jgi:hypothetical protein
MVVVQVVLMMLMMLMMMNIGPVAAEWPRLVHPHLHAVEIPGPL